MPDTSIEIEAAMAMIDTRRWRTAAVKLRILQVVKLNTFSQGAAAAAGVEMSARYVAEFMGMNVTRVRAVVAELLEERVLIVRDPGAGRRAAVVAIQPELRAWRVPWSIPIESVETRAALLSGRLSVHNPGVARVAWGRAQTIDARAAWARAEDPASGHPQGARATAPVARAPWQRAQRDDDARGAPIPTDGSSILPSERGIDGESDQTYQRVVKAIAARTHQPVLGAFLERVALASQGANVGEIVAAVHQAPAQLRMPALVALVEQIAGAEEPDPLTGLVGSSPAWLADPDCGRCEGSGWEDRPDGVAPCRCRTTRAPSVTCENAASTTGGL